MITSISILSVYEFAVEIFANDKSQDFENLTEEFKNLEHQALPEQSYISPILTGMSK